VTARRGITVVVPMYGDPDSLRRCLESLARTVEGDRDRVLLVNDMGPDADTIERVVAEVTGDDPRFRYERNERNLGFVGTCNRAALELDDTGNDILLLNSDAEPTAGFLDELSAVLHAAPDHGIVCPRSDNATIASLPHRLRDPQAARSPERTLAVHRALAPELPRFSVAPVSMGFCFLVRRELIDAHGLFDEAFSPGYGEENDFCLRMGGLGFRSLIAHRALVFHRGSRSFSRDRRAKLRAAHERLLVGRHPFYPAAVRAYLEAGADPVDVFADALAPDDTPSRVLVEPPAAGAARSAVERLAQAARQGGAIVTLAADTAVDSRVFDVGIVATSASAEQVRRLNRDCARWVVVEESAPTWGERVDAPAAAARREELLAFADVIVRLDEPGDVDVSDIARRPASLDRLRRRWWHYAMVAAQSDPSPRRTRPPGMRETLARRAPRLAAVARRVVRRLRRRGAPASLGT
jgi:GT2 family glycosyltransferase